MSGTDEAVDRSARRHVVSGAPTRTIDPSIFTRVVDTLSPAHPAGTGRTNVTIIAPTIVQLDTGVPFAGFEFVAGRRPGAVAMHVEPAAYGHQPGERYEVAFVVLTEGPTGFTWQAGFDADQRTGTATVNGQGVIAMSLGQFVAGATGLANIQQVSGAPWRWQRLTVRRPIELQPA